MLCSAHLPQFVIYNGLNTWGKHREIPHAPKQTTSRLLIFYSSMSDTSCGMEILALIQSNRPQVEPPLPAVSLFDAATFIQPSRCGDMLIHRRKSTFKGSTHAFLHHGTIHAASGE